MEPVISAFVEYEDCAFRISVDFNDDGHEVVTVSQYPDDPLSPTFVLTSFVVDDETAESSTLGQVLVAAFDFIEDYCEEEDDRKFDEEMKVGLKAANIAQAAGATPKQAAQVYMRAVAEYRVTREEKTHESR